MLNIAIVSPVKDAVSETFIKAHCELLNGNIFFLYGGVVPTASADGELGKSRTNKNGWTRILPLFIYQRLRKSPSDALETYLRDKRIDVVLAEYGPTGCGVLNVCQKLGLPLVVHFHGADASKYDLVKAYATDYRMMFDYAAAIISVSSSMTRRLEALGAAPEKMVYDVYGPNEAFYDISPDYQNGYFLSVGRFVDKKAPFLTLLAFQKVQQQFSNARLVMAGEGPLLGACRTLVQSLGLKHVDFVGAQSHSEVRKLFENAFCFVQHSVIAVDGDAEGTPVAILEAGAAALPVIATRHEGIADVVVHEQTGFLVEEGDVNGMAAYMGKLQINREQARTMGLSARMHIKNNFSIDRHIEILGHILEQASKTGRN